MISTVSIPIHLKKLSYIKINSELLKVLPFKPGVRCLITTNYFSTLFESASRQAKGIRNKEVSNCLPMRENFKNDKLKHC